MNVLMPFVMPLLTGCTGFAQRIFFNSDSLCRICFNSGPPTPLRLCIAPDWNCGSVPLSPLSKGYAQAPENGSGVARVHSGSIVVRAELFFWSRFSGSAGIRRYV